MTFTEYLNQSEPIRQILGSVKLEQNEVKLESTIHDTKLDLDFTRVSLTVHDRTFNYCVINGSGMLWGIAENGRPNVAQPSVFSLNKTK
jgi:hypothetical protein